jgi:hypothetical protein
MDTLVPTPPKWLSLLLILSLVPFVHAGYKPGPGWPEVSTPFYHAPSPSDVTARLAVWREHNLEIQGYRDTGSMHPVLKGGREVLAMERCRPDTPLTRGQMVAFNRGDLPAVLHYIANISRDGQYLYLSGVNNRRSDGWFPRTAVAYVVREVIVPPDLPAIAADRQMATAAPQGLESGPPSGPPLDPKASVAG